MKKIIFLLLVIILSASHVNSSPVVNRIVALVNGETITLFELQERVRYLLGIFEDVDVADLPESQLKQTQRQILDQMINDILLKQEAEKFGIEVSRRDIQSHISRISSESNISEEEFDSHLHSLGLNREAYEKQAGDSILRQRVLNMMVRRKVLVTTEEIENYYRDNISQYQEDKKVHLKVIIVPELEKAVRIREDIIRGETSFDQAAHSFSAGPNPSEGGDLGFIEWKRLAPEWRQALDNLDQGSLSEAFQVRGSGALLMLKDKSSGGAVPLSEVEEKIREQLFESKLDQRFEDYINGLRERAVIEIRL